MKFKGIRCWKLLPARRQREGFSLLLTGFGQTARVYMHTTLFFFLFPFRLKSFRLKIPVQLFTWDVIYPESGVFT